MKQADMKKVIRAACTQSGFEYDGGLEDAVRWFGPQENRRRARVRISRIQDRVWLTGEFFVDGRNLISDQDGYVNTLKPGVDLGRALECYFRDIVTDIESVMGVGVAA